MYIFAVLTYPYVPNWATDRYIKGIPRARIDQETLLHLSDTDLVQWFGFYSASFGYLALISLLLWGGLLIGSKFCVPTAPRLEDSKKHWSFKAKLGFCIGLIALMTYFTFLKGIPFRIGTGSIMSFPVSRYTLFWCVFANFSFLLFVPEVTLSLIRIIGSRPSTRC